MRITNNMIARNTSVNINANKLNVNALNNQMTTQKKISRPSEDPVIAMRSLRLSTALSEINQYYEKNIPDAASWLDVTETALTNMNKILTSVRTELTKGANGDLTATDRKTILSNLKALQEQLYSEGNADYAGRTVFTGYRTNSNLTFMTDEPNTTYNINQQFSSSMIESKDYLSGSVTTPTTITEIQATGSIPEIKQTTYDKLRLGYNAVDEMNGLSYSYTDGTGTAQTVTFTQDATDPTLYTATDPVSGTAMTMRVYESEDEWSAANTTDGSKTVADNELVFVKSTGELVLGETVSNEWKTNKASVSVDYARTGFTSGELRPEYYYNCTDESNVDPSKWVTYTKFDSNGKEIYQDINYTISKNQQLTINTQASDIFDMNIYQDMTQMINAVEAAIEANDKVDSITAMMNDSSYADYTDELQSWLDAATKEADYANDNLSNLFSEGIGNFDDYSAKVNLAITNLGTKGERLSMTESRMSSQQLNVEQLKSSNEDRDVSDIIIDYTAAYNSYQAALMAAAKLEKQSLLDYI